VSWEIVVIAELIRLLLAAACFSFILSVPLGKTEAGATLRRWAGVCAALAFLPSLIGGLFYPAPTASPASTSSTTSTTTSVPPPSVLALADDFFSDLGCAAAVLIVAFVAYGVLKLRTRLTSKSKPRDPWERFFNRGGGKRPFTINPNPRRTQDPFGDDEDDD
jgi:Na+/proline symporter